MASAPATTLVRYLLAVASATGAVALTLALERPLHEPPLSLFFAAVMISAWYGGLGPGLVATALSGVAIDFLFTEPRYSFALTPITVIRLALYVATSLLISWLNAQRLAAQAAASRLAAIVETSEDPIIGVDLLGKVTAWNAAAERQYGYAAHEIVGQPVTRLARQDEPTELPRILERLQRGERFGHFEAVRMAKDGRRIDVSVSASAIRNPSGAIVGASLIERDVTWRRAAVDATGRLAAIVASSDEAIVGKTLDGTITAWNPAAERLYGYATHEIVGRSVYTIVPPARADEMRDILDRIAAGERVERMETECVRKDGRRVRISLSVSPIRGPRGDVVGVSAIARELPSGQAGRGIDPSALRRQLAAAKDPIEALLEEARMATGADMAALFRWDPAREGLLAVRTVPPAAATSEPLPRGRGAAGQAIERGEVVLMNDYPHARGASSGAVQAGIQAAAGVPLTVGGKILGALTVATRASDRAFGPAEADALEALALAAAGVLAPEG